MWKRGEKIWKASEDWALKLWLGYVDASTNTSNSRLTSPFTIRKWGQVYLNWIVLPRGITRFEKFFLRIFIRLSYPRKRENNRTCSKNKEISVFYFFSICMWVRFSCTKYVIVFCGFTCDEDTGTTSTKNPERETRSKYRK